MAETVVLRQGAPDSSRPLSAQLYHHSSSSSSSGQARLMSWLARSDQLQDRHQRHKVGFWLPGHRQPSVGLDLVNCVPQRLADLPQVLQVDQL